MMISIALFSISYEGNLKEEEEKDNNIYIFLLIINVFQFITEILR